MLVYGDVETARDAATFQRDIASRLTAVAAMPPGLDRHATLVSAFTDAADLICALIDRDGRQHGEGLSITGPEALTELAGTVDTSWRSGLATVGDLARASRTFAALYCTGAIRTKPAEGYAFYSLYPETYAEAARLSGLSAATRVIGIRSIGISLAAMVAAALGAAPPITVRPMGHPFDRRLDPSPAMADAILGGDPPAFAVVDEGPGLSGSSFMSVMDWLAAQGVPLSRIHLFPSHLNGPGSEAGDERRRRWNAAPKHFVSFEQGIARHLPGWVSAHLGPLTMPLRSLSGGAWQHFADTSAPVAPGSERQKYLAQTATGRWLVKFAGLGSAGHDKLALARTLHADGFGPETPGLCHGFLIQRWIDAPNLTLAPLTPDQLIPQLAAYLALRAGMTMPASAGATPGTLVEMAVHNTGLALGQLAGAAMRARLKPVTSHTPLRRVRVDARMHHWEWLNLRGRLVKTDALDHAVAHDFVGAQPIEWDIAGALVEHDLTSHETRLISAFEAVAGRRVDRPLLAFLLGCYLAFQLGLWTMNGPTDGPMPAHYREKLSVWLGL